jgi:hypothetical protein
VCEESGFSCVNAGQCEASEACLSSGRVCSGSSFGAFSCADDGNCFDPNDPNAESGACVGRTERDCGLTAPCALEPAATGEVFGFSVNPLSSPATFDFYLAPIPAEAVGAVLVLRPEGGDADLYVGREVTAGVIDPADYPFASNNSEDSTDFVRLSPQSTPPFAEFTNGLDEFAVAVAGVGGATTYELEAIFLGASGPGDADCDGAASEDDLDGLLTVFYDPAVRLTPQGSPFGRCLGADGNADNSENAADLIAAITAIGAP